MPEDTESPKKKNWFAKHKVLTVILVLLALGAIGAAGSKSSNTQTVPSKSTGEQVAATSPTPQAEKMTITNSSVKPSQYGTTEVVGEIKNNDAAEHSATLKATFYGKDGKIMGTASGAVNNVAPGETKTFSLMTTDTIAGYDHLKVQVDSLL
jgi:cytoskeletal protein RodZ